MLLDGTNNVLHKFWQSHMSLFYWFDIKIKTEKQKILLEIMMGGLKTAFHPLIILS